MEHGEPEKFYEACKDHWGLKQTNAEEAQGLT